ncbi:MAG TPA: transposase [Enorma massiliensis]|uniref:transposase n=1 Tax=Enorma massiliensis TaxID=1472761 RepID=UPI001DA85FC3|nr:transposase [Enorma massiliensis]HJG62344.1 transposase [Enorma massiliensis]
MLSETGKRGQENGTPPPKCSAESRQQAVRLYRERGGTCAETARGLGCDAGSISDRVKRADAAQASPEDNPFKVAEENRRLRREVERPRRENEMLLRASAFFAGRRL